MTDTMPRDFFGFGLTGPQARRPLEGADLAAALEGADLAWAHLPFDPEAPDPALAWMADHVPGLDSATHSALVRDDSRARATMAGEGMLVILRGVNLNAGAVPEDMIGVRIYLDARRIVTLARRPLQSISEMARRMKTVQAPTTPGMFLHDLAEMLIDRIEDVLERLEDDTEALEDTLGAPDLTSGDARMARAEATRLRRMILGLRRHIAPQREALHIVAVQMTGLMTPAELRLLQEVQDRHQRAVEELDEMAGRLALVRDEIKAEQDERTNRNLYVLSILSALFLPLGFLTGLMGINLGGMPGAEWPLGFYVFSVVLVAIFVAQVVALRNLRRL